MFTNKKLKTHKNRPVLGLNHRNADAASVTTNHRGVDVSSVYRNNTICHYCHLSQSHNLMSQLVSVLSVCYSEHSRLCLHLTTECFCAGREC